MSSFPMRPTACAERGAGARRARGFTMIEVLSVIAIIAILSVMTMPALSERIVREQIVSAVPLADIAKSPIAAAWTATQTFPADNAAAGLPPADKIVSNYISSLVVADGAIHITFGNNANGLLKGKVLTLRPAVVIDTPIVPVSWICGNAPTPDKMTAIGENRTNLPAPLLPVNCRSD